METRNATLLGMLGGALLVLALAAGAFAAVSFNGPGAVQAQPGGVTAMRQVTVVGQGEVKLAPDQATIQIGVETRATTTREALDQNTAQAATIIEQMKQVGVEERDIQTSGFNIYANYSENGRTVTGYTVSNNVVVTVRNLEQTGALLDQVVAAGANRIYGINFGLSDREGALAQARDAAITNARARAERLAQGSGASLGSVLVITENIGTDPVMPMPAMMARDEVLGTGATVPVQPGEQTFNAQVQVTYELR
ncbi:MAG: DUF541 domain-containing protein [Candidatus Viridilinea halotolerans]|uniref:DUF541 domain-containing protein n=1 Tax=Candidatus Viridilinea halotolerans TaxID=2491704 RepID=A0A426TWT9_9CHLR|nr:MAG: DUF541 domain-containing protein [Candidatus Viridilinea halotolerans]